MKIAPHHIKGTAQNDLSEIIRPSPDYVPVCDWPEDCTVQWGHGIIPAVPFFEAFIPGTFIRGEGEDIAAAEQKAFEQYSREFLCSHHWGRLSPGPNGSVYANGAGWCRKCGAFRSKMFPELIKLGHMRNPLSKSEAYWLAELEKPRDPEFEAHMDRVYPGHTESCRKSRRLLRLRKNLFGTI